MKKKRVKVGTPKAATAHRREIFLEAYIQNGGDATQAAIATGFSPKRATVTGAELVTNRKVFAEIEKHWDALAAKFELTTDEPEPLLAMEVLNGQKIA